MQIRTRFAPSPTGYLHIGGVRTALFSWLFARHHRGEFALRIEDTDRERSKPEYIDAIVDGLGWVGLDWDEGPVYQSARSDRYREVAGQMLAAGSAYRCFCSPEELAATREAQIAAGQKPRYDGRCRDRQDHPEDSPAVIRFKTPRDGQVVVEDLVRGRVVFENSELDDLVIMRRDASPTYHFSVVVDDADLAITHVVRGDDHLNNTPRQINIIEALSLPRPTYAHLPMILGADGARMSKRHGAVNVLEYRDQGYLPEALLNYLVRLGWSHGDREIFSVEEMIALFDIADVNPAASRFDQDKLAWMNQQYIMQADAGRLIAPLREQFRQRGIAMDCGPPPEAVIEAYRERATTLAEMAEASRYLYADFDVPDAKAAKKHLRGAVREPLAGVRAAFAGLGNWERAALQAAIQQVTDAAGIGFGKLGQPLRVAVTGTAVSPPIDVTLELVGRPRSLQRIDAALAYIDARQASD